MPRRAKAARGTGVSSIINAALHFSTALTHPLYYFSCVVVTKQVIVTTTVITELVEFSELSCRSPVSVSPWAPGCVAA